MQGTCNIQETAGRLWWPAVSFWLSVQPHVGSDLAKLGGAPPVNDARSCLASSVKPNDLANSHVGSKYPQIRRGSDPGRWSR